jgi:hypothetical protein
LSMVGCPVTSRFSSCGATPRSSTTLTRNIAASISAARMHQRIARSRVSAA